MKRLHDALIPIVLLLGVAPGKYRVANTCARSQSYTRPMTGKERADGKTYLMVGPGGGTDSRSHFSRPSS